jgi:hypothetical protein
MWSSVIALIGADDEVVFVIINFTSMALQLTELDIFLSSKIQILIIECGLIFNQQLPELANLLGFVFPFLLDKIRKATCMLLWIFQSVMITKLDRLKLGIDANS